MESKADRIHAKLNEQVRGISEPQPSTSGYNKGNKNNKGVSPRKEEPCATKQLKWDKSALERLVSAVISYNFRLLVFD